MVRILFNSALIWVMCCGFSVNHAAWQQMSDGIHEGRVKAAGAVNHGSHAVLAATDRGIYRARAEEKFFQQVLMFPAGQDMAYSLSTDGQWAAAATDSGIWQSSDAGEHWEHVFYPTNEDQRQCYAVFKDGERVVIGTADGVFIRKEDGGEWDRHSGIVGRDPVYAIAGGGGYLFFSADDGIYREDIRKPYSIEKIFSVVDGTGMSDEIIDQEGEEEDPGFYQERFIRSMAYDPASGQLVAAACNGFWMSDDSGESWEELPSSGFSSCDSEKIIFCKQFCLTSHGQRAPDIQDRDGRSEPEPILFLASRQGVFVFWERQWHDIYGGLTVKGINDIFEDENGRIFIASDSGLFFLTERSEVTVDYRKMQNAWAHEPSVQEVHQMVTFYADVGKDKIDRWKNLSRRKAVLPSVSWQVQRDLSDIYHWDSGANPDAMQKGVESLDWSVTLKWELADLVWSTAQTSIDTRAKMMVELREDLLAQATRIYFERRRLQAESSQIPDSSPEKWQIQLRVDELTAGLDAMTGGAFSRRNAVKNQ